jgi:hypothetical protein
MKCNVIDILLELEIDRLKLNPNAMVGIDAIVELGFGHCIAFGFEFEVNLSLSSCLMKRVFVNSKRAPRQAF